MSYILEPNTLLLRVRDLDDAKGGLISLLHGYKKFL